MDPTVLTQLLAALQSGHYLPLIIILTLYVRKLASPDSKCPLNIPTTWLPIVSAFGGLAYGFEASLQKGESVGTAAIQALVVAASTGFFDGMVTVLFAHSKAPGWAKAIVFLVDDIAGGGGGSGSVPTNNVDAPKVDRNAKTDPPRSPRTPLAVLMPLGARMVTAIGMCLVLLTASCSTLNALIPELVSIDNIICADLAANDTDTQIVNDVEAFILKNASPGTVLTVQEISDIVLSTLSNLIASGLLAKHYAPSVVAYAKTIQTSMLAKAAERRAVK